MKRILYFTLLLAACFCFSGCDKGDEPEPKPEPEKPFVWNGDWNDPKDPNYKKEGYNPIEGEWQNIKNPTVIQIFTEDFQIKRRVFDTYYGTWITRLWVEKYTLNDTAFRYVFTGLRSTQEYIIFKENGKEYLMTRYIPVDESLPWNFWVRYTDDN